MPKAVLSPAEALTTAWVSPSATASRAVTTAKTMAVPESADEPEGNSISGVGRSAVGSIFQSVPSQASTIATEISAVVPATEPPSTLKVPS